MDRQPDTMGSGGRDLDRRSFVKAIGLAGVGLAGVGLALTPGLPAGAAASSLVRKTRDATLTPMDLAFSVAEQYRPFDLVAKNFVQLHDRFTAEGAANYEPFAPAPENNVGSVTFGDGQLRISGESFFSLFRSETRQAAPYASVVVDIASFAGTTGTEDTVLTGLVKDSANY